MILHPLLSSQTTSLPMMTISVVYFLTPCYATNKWWPLCRRWIPRLQPCTHRGSDNRLHWRLPNLLFNFFQASVLLRSVVFVQWVIKRNPVRPMGSYITPSLRVAVAYSKSVVWYIPARKENHISNVDIRCKALAFSLKDVKTCCKRLKSDFLGVQQEICSDFRMDKDDKTDDTKNLTNGLKQTK